MFACLITALAPARGAEWETRTIDELSLDTPAAFKDAQNIFDSLPPEVKAAIGSYNIRMAGDESQNLIVAVAMIRYKDGFDVTIDGAINGGMTSAAKSLGDPNPKFTVSKFKADNIEIRRAFYEKPDSTNFIRAQVLRRGQQIWQIQVIGDNKNKIADADRVLDSIVLKAGK